MILPAIEFDKYMSKYGSSEDLSEQVAGVLNRSSNWASYICVLREDIQSMAMYRPKCIQTSQSHTGGFKAFV
jgi:hypothetical protein